MKFGSPLAAGFGEPEMAVSYIKLIPVTHGVLARFMARSGWGNAYFGLYNNGILVANVFAPEGIEPAPVRISANYFANQISVVILRLGHLGDQGYNIARIARTYEALDSGRVTLLWTWKPRIIGPQNDGGYTSAWSLSGLSRNNTNGVSGSQNWSQLSFDFTVTGSSVTVTVRRGQSSVASGVGTVGNVITLSALNGSQISGSVTIANTAVTTTNATLLIRWPAAMKIRRDSVNPPVNVAATIPFDGLDSANWTEFADLAAGTWYYNLTEVSETGVDGTQSSPAFSEVITAPPTPASNLTYISGNAASGITLGFSPSSTAGATYRLYLGQIGAQMDLNSIAATASAGATQITTPALTGAPGTAHVLLRAVNAGVEEKSLTTFDITLDSSGNYVPTAPNTPTIVASSVVLTAGLSLALRGTYSTLNEEGTATQLNLYARTPTGSYGSVLATSALAASSTGIKSAALTYTFPSSGLRYIALRAATASGVLSAWSDEVEINPDSSLMSPPDNAFAFVSRG